VLALAFVTLLSSWATSPATAAEGDQLVVTVDQPPDAPPLSSSTVVVSGVVTVRDDLNRLLLGSEIDSVTAKLFRQGDGSPIGEHNVCRSCPVRDGQVRFSANIPEVSINGRYRVELAAFKSVLAPGVADLRGTGDRTFGVAAPPRAPQDVKVEVSPERVVTVSWSRNPERDMLSYSVRRKDPGSESYRPIGSAAADSTTPRVSFSDSLPGTIGGDLTYQVVAIRRGASPGTNVRSEPTTTDKVSVPTGGTAPGAGVAGPGLGTFPPAQSNSTAARARPPELPDTGFSESLPFGARPPGEEIIEEGEQEPRSLEVGTTTTEFVSRGRPLVPVAAGAILLLLAVHLRLLNSRMKSAPATVGGHAHTDLAPLDVGPPDDGPPDRGLRHPPLEQAPAVETFPAPPPRSWLYDYEQMAPPVDDDRWAERDWDDDEVREVDRDLREVMVSRAR